MPASKSPRRNAGVLAGAFVLYLLGVCVWFVIFALAGAAKGAHTRLDRGAKKLGVKLDSLSSWAGAGQRTVSKSRK